MTLSGKLLFCMLNINKFSKNSFLPYIYLLYVCIYVYHEFACTWYVNMYFHVFFAIFGVDNDYVIIFISHIKF